VLWASRAPERALGECERAIALDPNSPDAQALAGWLKVFVGRAEETEAQVAEAMRLSPRDPELGIWRFHVGVANLLLGRLDRAVENLRRSVDANPRFGLVYFLLAAALALAGRETEAAETSSAGLRLVPNFSVTKFRAELQSDNPVFLAQHEQVFEGMRRAGVPE
jgi:tetratricopeptide (TPR) repeat protein